MVHGASSNIIPPNNMEHLVLLLACLCPLAASLTISVPDPVLEGTSLVINCITSGGGAGSVVLHRNGQISAVSGVVQQSNITVSAFDLGAVDRSNSGATYQCVSGFDGSMSAQVTLDVQWPPSFSLSVPSGSVQQYLEGSSQVVTVQGLDLGKPPAPRVEWSVNGGGLISGGGVTVSDASISFSDVRRSHSGEYSAVVSNVHGNVTADFTVDVTYPPELVTLPSPVALTIGSIFSFNCTPSAANPPVDTVSIAVDGSPVTNSDTVTVTDSILTIPSVQRSHSGNYSCTATNTHGSAVIYQHLLIADGVPLIAQVAVRFLTSSSLEVVTRLTTNGIMDVLRYHIVLNGVASVFSGGGNQSVLSATVSTGGPRHRGEEGEEWSVSVVVENELGNSSEVVVVLQGQPSSVSDAVTVADMSSAVIGLSVTVALVIVISVTIVIISLVVIIVLCHRQASYEVKAPSAKEGDYQMEDTKEVKLESNPAYEAVTTS